MVRRTGPGRRAIYPWDRWFRAGSFSLVAGQDYECATHGMMQMIRSRASERGVRVSISLLRTREEFDTIHTTVIDAEAPSRGKGPDRRHAAKVRPVRR